MKSAKDDKKPYYRDSTAQYRLGQWESLGGDQKRIYLGSDAFSILYISSSRYKEFRRALALLEKAELSAKPKNDNTQQNTENTFFKQWRYILMLSYQRRLQLPGSSPILTPELQATWSEVTKEPEYMAVLAELTKTQVTKADDNNPNTTLQSSPTDPKLVQKQYEQALSKFSWQILACYQNRISEEQLFAIAKQLSAMRKILESNSQLSTLPDSQHEAIMQFYLAMGIWHLGDDTSKAKQYLNEFVTNISEKNFATRIAQTELDLLK